MFIDLSSHYISVNLPMRQQTCMWAQFDYFCKLKHTSNLSIEIIKNLGYKWGLYNFSPKVITSDNSFGLKQRWVLKENEMKSLRKESVLIFHQKIGEGFLAAIAALYVAMSVGRSVGRLVSTSFKEC